MTPWPSHDYCRFLVNLIEHRVCAPLHAFRCCYRGVPPVPPWLFQAPILHVV